MEEEYSTINNNINSNETTTQIVSLSNARRLQIRRGSLRQATALRSLPYNSTLSNLRRRQTSFITSQTISNLISNIDSDNISTNLNALPSDHVDNEAFSSEVEIIQNDFLITSDDEDDNENFEVLIDFSNPTPIDLNITDESHDSYHEQNPSYHSLSNVDFHPNDDDNNDDDDEVADDHQFYYTSTSIPIIDYSSSSTSSSLSSPSLSTAITTTTTATTTATAIATVEPLLVHTNTLAMPQNQYYDEYFPLINNNSNNHENLTVEIILENSPTNPLSTRHRRRRSMISSNIRNNQGLRLSDILSIPQIIYSSLKEQINDNYQPTIMTNTQCYICLEDFLATDSIKILNCQHIFHSECTNEWLRNHTNCAYCRTPVLVDMFRPSSSATSGRRQRTRIRRNHNTIERNSTNNSSQPISIENSTLQ